MDFNTLLQQAQKLTNETQALEELPKVERTLPQILQATQELHNRITKTQDIQDVQAHTLLGTKGVDLQQISQKLEALSARKTFEPLDPIVDTDIQSFLRNERENAVLSVIEEVHKNSYKTAQSQKWNSILNEWKQEKAKLMNALIGPSQNWLDIRKGPEQTILNETTFGRRSALDNQEMAYAREVAEYNWIVLENGMRPSLVQKFGKVAQGFNDSKVSDMWEILSYMVKVPPMPRTEDPIKSRAQCTQLIDQAKKYLETRYKIYMQTVIVENLREAECGGVPSTYSIVSAFVRLKFNDPNNTTVIGLQDVQSDGKPVWPMVYYSLRCGDIKSALDVVKEVEAENEDIVAILEEKLRRPDQKVSSNYEKQIRLLYKRQIRNATDPYKRAVYCIIGCCDAAEHHPEVAKSSDDFLWIKLSMIRTNAEDASDYLTYSALQTMILEQYGEKHYNAAEQPHLYFQVLALTGQFEAAIEFLARTEKYRTHAVHIALALNEMFLIGGPRNIQEPLLSVDIEDPVPMRRLNLARLVLLYVKKFEITDPAEALQYFYFLRNLRDPHGRNLFLVCVTDLAIECRDFDLLFGKIQENGVRSRGLIDQFESIDIDVPSAANMVGDELVKKGIFEDAIKVYDIAGNYEQAIYYTSVMLSQVVHQPSKPNSLRERLQLKAQEFANRYGSVDFTGDAQIVNTFNLLRDLASFFDAYHENNFMYATEILEKVKLVPMNMSQIESCVNSFKNLKAEVVKVYPDVLMAAMDILFKKYKTLKAKEPARLDDVSRERQLQFLREQAKAITNLAAMIPYRMPGDTNSRLVQTEILMN